MRRVSIMIGALLVATGCGGGSQRASVTGNVLLDKQPLNTGTVLFIPENGGPSAKGTIHADGSYELQTDDGHVGAVLGSYYVGVIAFSEKGRYKPNYVESETGRSTAVDSGELVPVHYMDPTTSGITYEVKSGNNEFTIELSSKK